MAGVFAETFKRAVAVMRAMLNKGASYSVEQKGLISTRFIAPRDGRRETRRIARDEG